MLPARGRCVACRELLVRVHSEYENDTDQQGE